MPMASQDPGAFHDYQGSYTSDMTTYQRFFRRVSDLVPWQRSYLPQFSISFPNPATDPWVYEVSVHDGSGKVRWLGERKTGIYAVLSLDDRSGQPLQNHARYDALKAKESVIRSGLQGDSELRWCKLRTAAWLGFRRQLPGTSEEWEEAAEWAARKLVDLEGVCGPLLRDKPPPGR